MGGILPERGVKYEGPATGGRQLIPGSSVGYLISTTGASEEASTASRNFLSALYWSAGTV